MRTTGTLRGFALGRVSILKKSSVEEKASKAKCSILLRLQNHWVGLDKVDDIRRFIEDFDHLFVAVLTSTCKHRPRLR